MKYFYKQIFTVIFLGSIIGCSSDPRLPDSAHTQLGPSVLTDSYKMSVADKVEINVWKNPELSTSEPIRPDGKISMPLIGDVMAVGLTPEELSSVIEKKLSAYVKNPNVTVILTEIPGYEFLSRIRVTGAVAQDMSINYKQGMTVLDAILAAGSIDQFADANDTKLHRRTPQGAETYDIRLKDIMKKGDMTTNIYLLPGDIITVPERLF